MIGSSFPREEDAFIEIVKGRARSGASLLTVFLIAWAAAPNQQAWTLHSGTMVLNVPSDWMIASRAGQASYSCLSSSKALGLCLN